MDTSLESERTISNSKTNFINNDKDYSDNVYHKMILQSTIKIEPSNMNGNINENLEMTLKNKVEGICIKEGYVKPNSINIISRTTGKMTLAIFDGNISYTLNYQALVCNPSEGDEIICTIQDINKSTINAYIEDPARSPLNIFLARQHHIDNQEYLKLKKNDKIKIKIIGKKFEYLDSNILVFGNLIKKIE